MAQKEFLSNAGLEHYDEKIKEYIGDHSNVDIVALKEESPATAAHSVGEYITYNHIVYEVIDDISIDDLLIVDSNIEVATLAEGTVIYSDDDNGGGSSSSYNNLTDKPKINNVELSGNKTASDLGLVASEAGKGLSTNDYSDTEKGKVADNASDIVDITSTMAKNGAHNLLPLTLELLKSRNTSGTWNNNIYTCNGLTFTINSDMTFTVSGTATDDTELYMYNRVHYPLVFDDGTYKASGVAGGSDSTYYLNIVSSAYTKTISNEEVEFEYDSAVISGLSVGFKVNNGIAISTAITIKPMIRLASDTNPEFAPYAMPNRELTEKVNNVVLNGVVFNMDLNTIKTPGFYQVQRANTNTPSTEIGNVEWAGLIVTGDGSDFVQQIFINHGGRAAARSWFTNTWSPWLAFN